MTGKTHSSRDGDTSSSRERANTNEYRVRHERSRSPGDKDTHTREREEPKDAEEKPLSEDEIIALRRRKREALIARLAESETSTPPSVTEYPGSSLELAQLASSHGDVLGASAADYDEFHNEDRKDVGPATTTAPEEPDSDNDSDSDDMFADSPVTKTTTKSTGKKLDSSLLDNWDDVEGYYRIIPGEILDGQYLVSNTLGKGMFAAVVRAIDQHTNTPVAIKIIRNNETMQKAGYKELGILNAIKEKDPQNKKHVVRLLRYFDHKEHLCLVFENLDCNLRDILKKFGRNVGINIQAIKSYSKQLLIGLALLRDCNIMHADLKPDNILANDKHNVLKICDLGSASDVSENEITPYLVSRFYRAPELILGLPYNCAIDMWSIGCTLYELYTGKILFPGNSNNHMLRIIMETMGKFNHKVLRKGQFTFQHFDDNLDFLSNEVDKVTGRPATKVVKSVGPLPTQTLKARLAGLEGDLSKGADPTKVKLLEQFTDFLDKMLITNPDKRITPREALAHPFIAG